MKKVKIYSIHYNRPDFVKWQFDSFKAHLKDEMFEYFVINNAREQHVRDAITRQATELGLSENVIHTHSDTPFHLAGKHHADSLNMVWKSHMVHDKDCYVVFVDGDCFLIKDFSVNEFMNDEWILAGPRQQREYVYHYLTPTIVIANMEKLPEPETIDWEGTGVNGTRLDTGGGLYWYYEKHPEIKSLTKPLNSSWHIKQENGNKHCLPKELLQYYDDSYHIEFFGNEFLHYCRSSNWDHQSQEHHINKSNFVLSFIYSTINGTITAVEHNFQMPNDYYFGWGKLNEQQ